MIDRYIFLLFSCFRGLWDFSHFTSQVWGAAMPPIRKRGRPPKTRSQGTAAVAPEEHIEVHTEVVQPTDDSRYSRNRDRSRSPLRSSLGRSRRRRGSSARATGSPSETRSQFRHRLTSRDESFHQRMDRLEELVAQLRPAHSATSHVPFAVRGECIPEFTPGEANSTTSSWINKIEQICSINGWNDKVAVHLFQSRLAGTARRWYNNLRTYDYSWSEWKDMLRRTFPDHTDFAENLRKLVERRKRPSETITQYYLEKMELLRTAKIDGRDAVACVIDGLADSAIQAAARAGNYSTPEKLYERCLCAMTEGAGN